MQASPLNSGTHTTGRLYHAEVIDRIITIPLMLYRGKFFIYFVVYNAIRNDEFIFEYHIEFIIIFFIVYIVGLQRCTITLDTTLF